MRAIRPLLGRPEPVAGLPPGVAVVRGAWVPRLGGWFMRAGYPAAAVTLGSTIVVHPAVALTPRLLEHELAHVRQWAERPLGFPFLYIWHHIRLGYDRNPFEVEARAAERSSTRRHG